MGMDKARSGLPQIERRFIPCNSLEIREAEGDEPRRLSGYAAIFDVLSPDQGGFRERIGRRAFTKTVAEDDIRALVNHDPSQVLARTSRKSLKLSVDHTGLHANALLPDTSYARDLVINIANGNISGGSFMFETIRDTWAEENLDGAEIPVVIRTLNEVRLYDVSPVTFPAYPQTEGTVSIRSLLDRIKPCLHCQTPCEEQSRGCRREAIPAPINSYRLGLLKRRLVLAK